MTLIGDVTIPKRFSRWHSETLTMRLRRRTASRVAVGVVLAALLAGAIAGAGAGSPGADGAVASPESPDTPADRATAPPADAAAAAQEVDADRTRIRIDLTPDGDAVWTLELWTRLEDDADRTAFEDLQADVESNESVYAGDFRDRMTASIQSASEETGRSMAIRNVSVSTRTEGVPSSYGVLVYEFEWTSFAAVDGDRLRAGDAIDGFLLEENTRLTIRWPESYREASVTPEPDDRSERAVVWRGGETDFTIGEPRLVVTTASQEESLLPLLGAGAVIVVVGALVVWLGYTGRLPMPGRGESREEPPASADSAAPTGEATSGADGASAEPPATPGEGTSASGAGADAAGTAAAAGAAGETAEDAEAGPEEGVPPELLSNEEQVLRLLEAHGGRMKQQQVVSELEWTEAKTSQVVTSMRDEDQIEIFRIGRENVLALPEEADL